MQVHFQTGSLPNIKNAIVTIGTFDGVHQGHRAILDRLKKLASECQGESVVITFHPHPRRILKNSEAPSMLTSLDERIERFQELGIDHLAIIPFDHEFANLSAEAYINEFLIKHFKPKGIVIGFDHRFGKGRGGDFKMLEEAGKKAGFLVYEIPEHVLNQSKVSSTQIRHFLLEGNVKMAKELLAYPYQLRGTVIEGDKLGRTIGFPTANLAISDSDKLIPASGVYAVKVTLFRDQMQQHETGMMNIGYRPTVNGKERRIEVHLFNFNEDIYHETLRVELIFHTRKEMKFDGIASLKRQLEMDKQMISELLLKH
jgi:riboflavin kinase / FMN adenylyltransferase